MAKSAYNNISTIFYYNYITLSASYGHVIFIASRSYQNLVGLDSSLGVGMVNTIVLYSIRIRIILFRKYRYKWGVIKIIYNI